MIYFAGCMSTINGTGFMDKERMITLRETTNKQTKANNGKPSLCGGLGRLEGVRL